MKEIQLSQHGKYKGKYVALVDDEDYEYLNQWNWTARRSKRNIYAVRSVIVDGRKPGIRMHRVIMGEKEIDHIDHNGLNNQKSNLRVCTRSENMMNRRKQENCTSIYKGVHFHEPSKKWNAQININGKKIHLGYFDSEVDAAKAYNQKAIELFCEFANLNNVD